MAPLSNAKEKDERRIPGLPLFGTDPDPFVDPAHRDWLASHRTALLDFYQPELRLSSGGYAWLDNWGQTVPERGAQLWIGSRMVHIFSLATMLGRSGAAGLVDHGLDFYLDGVGRDHRYGGWYPTVGGSHPDDRKELYGIAQLVLAGASATMAGFRRGAALMDEALGLIDRYFWMEEWGRCAEGYNRQFTDLDPYRGQNANMHLTEAYLAAYEATGQVQLLERASRIAHHIAGPAANTGMAGSWRLPEHFHADWRPLPDYNIDDPRHPFRPYGSQIGHWLEWSKLLMQLVGQGISESWLPRAAEALFNAAVTEGWIGEGGFCYTVDWNGNPVVRERFFWEPPEAMGAARLLWLHTQDPRYLDWYRRFWEFSYQRFLDHERGGWHSELDDAGEPVIHTWDGKPDLYHVFQATLYALLPADVGLAGWAASLSASDSPTVS